MITRTIEVTTLTIACIEVVENEPKMVNKTITYYGKKTEREISKLVGNATVLKSETTENVYEMTLENFVNNSTVRKEN